MSLEKEIVPVQGRDITNQVLPKRVKGGRGSQQRLGRDVNESQQDRLKNKSRNWNKKITPNRKWDWIEKGYHRKNPKNEKNNTYVYNNYTTQTDQSFGSGSIGQLAMSNPFKSTNSIHFSYKLPPCLYYNDLISIPIAPIWGPTYDVFKFFSAREYFMTNVILHTNPIQGSDQEGQMFALHSYKQAWGIAGREQGNIVWYQNGVSLSSWLPNDLAVPTKGRMSTDFTVKNQPGIVSIIFPTQEIVMLNVCSFNIEYDLALYDYRNNVDVDPEYLTGSEQLTIGAGGMSRTGDHAGKAFKGWIINVTTATNFRPGMFCIMSAMTGVASTTATCQVDGSNVDYAATGNQGVLLVVGIYLV